MDPRGPLRVIVEVREPSFSETQLVLECGHWANVNPLYTYRVGQRHNCIRCREIQEISA